MNIVVITSKKFAAHNRQHEEFVNPLFVSDRYGGNGYGSNVDKFIAGVILANEVDDWSLHLDHDACINPYAIARFSMQADPNAIWCRINIGSWSDDRSLNYPSGPCILLSHRMRTVLIPRLLRNSHRTHYADVILGLSIRDLGLQMKEFPFDFHHYQTPAQLHDNYSNYCASLQ